LSGAGTGVVEQYLPHDAGRYRQEMHLAGEAVLLTGEEFQICLVDERGSLQGVIGPFRAQMAGGDAVQFVIQWRQDFIQRRLIPGT
jgi:hypothetical protein